MAAHGLSGRHIIVLIEIVVAVIYGLLFGQGLCLLAGLGGVALMQRSFWQLCRTCTA